VTERINGIPVENGMYGTVPEDEYHADRGSLSQSGAKILVGPAGPAKFREYIDGPRKVKKAWDFGHVAHRIVLGEGATLAVLDPAVVGLNKDGSPSANPAATAGWKTAVREARERGETPVTIADYRIAEQMAAKVKAHPVAGPLFARGHAEVSLYTTDEETGVRMRGRCDWITNYDFGDGDGEQSVIVDYKTCDDADPDAWTRKAIDHGYHIQHPWYQRLYADAMKAWKPPRFLFVCQEKSSPYLVAVIELPAEAVAIGTDKMREALRVYRDCTDSGIWPGYGEWIHRGSLPTWMFGSRRQYDDEPAASDLPTLRDLITSE
jgi:hypothetical protein